MSKSIMAVVTVVLLALMVQVGSACTYLKYAYPQTNGSYKDIKAYMGCNNVWSEGYSVSMDYQYTYKNRVYREQSPAAMLPGT